MEFKISKEKLTEQERIASIATMYAITQAVFESGHAEILDVASGIELESKDVSKILNLPIEVVNAALENLQEDGKLDITGSIDLE